MPELATLAAVMTAVTLVAGGRGRDVDDLLRRARPLPPGVRPARPRLARPTRRGALVALAGAALVAAAALGEGGGYAGVAVGVLGASALRAAAEHRRVVARQRDRGVVLLVAQPLARGEPERPFAAPA